MNKEFIENPVEYCEKLECKIKIMSKTALNYIRFAKSIVESSSNERVLVSLSMILDELEKEIKTLEK